MVPDEPRNWPVEWSAKLARPLTLQNGDKLVTLEDAGRAVVEQMAIEIQNWALAHALQQLIAAAKTGSYADRRAATDQVAIVLRGRSVY